MTGNKRDDVALVLLLSIVAAGFVIAAVTLVTAGGAL